MKLQPSAAMRRRSPRPLDDHCEAGLRASREVRDVVESAAAGMADYVEDGGFLKPGTATAGERDCMHA